MKDLMKLTVTALLALMAVNAFSQTASEQIRTLDGRTYKAAKVQRMEPDGISIAYTPDGGGVGMAKLKFETLPEDLRQRFSHDPEKAAAYAEAQAEARVAYATQLWLEYQQATNRIALRMAQQEAEAHEQEMQAKVARQEAERDRIVNEWLDNYRRRTEVLERMERRTIEPTPAP
jgi:hypothetical protein